MSTRIELRIEETADELVIHVEGPGIFGYDEQPVEATIRDGVLVIRAPLPKGRLGGLNPDASGV